MPTPSKANPPDAIESERTNTDKSLQTERSKSDEEYEDAQKPIEEQSDAVVQKARDSADQVLKAARNRAESRLEAARKEQREVVTEERARADALLRQERTAADVAYTELRKARKIADSDLKDARAQADIRLEEVRAHEGEIVKSERARAKETLRGEQDTADFNLLEERGRRDILLAQLLRVERSETDLKLLLERSRADHAVVTRDEFLGMVTHDVRSMLSSITMIAGMIVKNASDDDRTRVSKWAVMIENSAARIDRLVGDLVDVASIELGNLSVLPRTHDAVAVLSDVMDAFQSAAQEKGIVLTAEAVEGKVFATFDRDRIHQVLGNLVSNAIKFSKRGGKIVLRLEPADGCICFSVRDSGVGIRSDQLEMVFERFWQVTQGDRRGIGLGLFISRRLVEAHGRRIWATSKPGVGSTFFFTLPAVGPAGDTLH